MKPEAPGATVKMVSPCFITPGLTCSKNMSLFMGTYSEVSVSASNLRPSLSMRVSDTVSRVTAPRAGPLGRLTRMTQEGRPTGIKYEDAADAAMHGGSVDFEGRKVRVLSLNSNTGTDEAPSAQLDLDLGEEYLVLIGYFWDGKFMETSRERPLEDTT